MSGYRKNSTAGSRHKPINHVQKTCETKLATTVLQYHHILRRSTNSSKRHRDRRASVTPPSHLFSPARAESLVRNAPLALWLVSSVEIYDIAIKAVKKNTSSRESGSAVHERNKPVQSIERPVQCHMRQRQERATQQRYGAGGAGGGKLPVRYSAKVLCIVGRIRLNLLKASWDINCIPTS